MISSIKRLIKERLVPEYGAKPDFSFKSSDREGLYIHYVSISVCFVPIIK